jgi:hypothetical protein
MRAAMKLNEFLARCLAARKMRLVKDPHGMKLPEDLWVQAMPEAEFIVDALIAFDLHQTVCEFYQAEDDGE